MRYIKSIFGFIVFIITPIIVALLFYDKAVEGFRTNNQKDYILFYFLAGVALFCTSYFFFNKFRKRCRDCGKWNAMVLIKKEAVSERSTKIRKFSKETHRNRDGEITGSTEREIYVPAIEINYHCNEQCKFCGVVYEFNDYETIEE